MSASPQREGDGDPEVAPPAEDSNDAEQKQATEGDPDMQDPDALYAIEVKEQDRWLPIANVARIMKTALPDNAKIAKEAKECMQECVSEFISFITSEASEKCQQEKRKTVNGEDILFAMASLGFENYGEALKSYLARYREANVAKNEQNRPSSSYEASGVPVAAGTAEEPGQPQPGADVNEPVLGVPSAVDPTTAAVAPGLATVGDAHDLPPANAGFRADGFGDQRPELDVENPVASFAPPARNAADEISTTNGDSIKLEYAGANPVAPELAEPQAGGNDEFKYAGAPDTTY